ncbi:hypothetical protein OIO90_003505 [Microbotryomycetes sp. JL221]|nr:hypothetical protein OIO90_003505 [Microbotryomycetes sp. JL221]
MEFLNDLDWVAPPVAINDGSASRSTNDSAYSDLFQQYLGSEVAKLPSTSAAEDYPFSAATSTALLQQSDMTFDPSTFMPLAPGSPVGAFSPSSTNSGHRFASMSPTSFPDLEEQSSAGPTNDWTLDPGLFAPIPAATATMEQPETIEHEDETTGVAPPLLASALPALPDIQEQAEEQLPETHVSESQRSTSRSKRQHSAHPTESTSSESDNDSEASDYAGNGRTRRRTVVKKQKSATPSAAIATPAASTPAASSRQPKTSVSQFATKELHFTNSRVTLAPVPDWTDRPDPETYKKLSSKEKRQLRNKISARNFRHRRKEQLTSLEDEISSRDQIIAQLRDEVGVMKTENESLRSEVTMLKQKWDEMIEKMTSITSAQNVSSATTGLGVNTQLAKQSGAVASTSTSQTPVVKVEDDTWALDSPQEMPSPPVTSSGRRPGTRGSNGIVKPNLNKDVAPGMPRRTNSWTTNHFGGGFTSVHTTLLPEINFAAANANAKPALYSGSFNPTINALSSSQMAQLPNFTSHLRETGLSTPSSQQSMEGNSAPKGTFEDFFGSNPLWLRAGQVEEYRASLYGKLAHNAAGLQASQKLQQQTNSMTLPLPTGFRPAFFSTPSAATLRDPPPPYSPPRDDLTFGSDKQARDVAPTSADLFRAQQNLGDRERQTVVVASLATQTLFGRMASAFMDAFVGSEISSTRQFNADKVASVLSGQSRLAIVPNETQMTASARSEVDALDSSFGRMNLNLTNEPRQTRQQQSCSFDEIRSWISGCPRSDARKPQQ